MVEPEHPHVAALVNTQRRPPAVAGSLRPFERDGRFEPPSAVDRPRVQVSPRNRSVAHPQIVLTAAGSPVVFWEGTAADRGIWSSTRQRDGRFAVPVRISGPVRASYPVAAFASDGLLVAWLEHEGTSATVRVSRQR